jgi:pimeloyl-ACP methyl ester carboxylesterase
MWRAAIVAMGLSAFASSACCKVRITPDSFVLHRAVPLPVMSETESRANVELAVSPGVVLRGWYLHAPGNRRLVIFFHGNGAGVLSSAWALNWLGAEFDADVLAFDSRGFGFSDGPADIDAMIDDSLRIYDYAIKQGRSEETKQGRSEEPPIVIGQSMGSSSAIHIGANRPATGLLLLAPLISYRDVIEAIDRAAPWYVHVEADETLIGLRSSPLLDLAHIRAATLIVGAAEDRLATPRVVARVHDLCAAPVRQTCTVQGGHEDVTAINPRVRACIDDFRRNLPSPAHPAITGVREDG